MTKREILKILVESIKPQSCIIFLEGDIYVAQSLEHDIASQGATVQEAFDNLREAIGLYLSSSTEEDLVNSASAAFLAYDQEEKTNDEKLDLILAKIDNLKSMIEGYHRSLQEFERHVVSSELLDRLAQGMTPEDIAEKYPSLTVEDIRARLAYMARAIRENKT